MKHDDKGLKRKKVLNLIDKLFGRPEELPEQELNALYQQISPERDPKEWIRSMAQETARTYRLRQENVPYHVQAILDASSERSIQDIKPSEMKNLIESLLAPKPARKVRQSFAFRKKSGEKLSEKDRDLLDRLASEIGEQDEEES
jgi:hypothetical protein